MGVKNVKVYLVCSRSTLVVFYCLLLFLVILGVIGLTVNNYAIKGDTEESRNSYLYDLGVVGVSQPVSCKEITIPIHFNEFYVRYNSILSKANINLKRFCGNNAQLFTYEYNEYYIHLIIIKGKIVGGDISEKLYGGYILPLTKNNVYEINKT